MKIAAVETTIVKIPTTGIQPPGFRERNVLLVEVRTDEGLSGWGEAFGFNIIPATKVVIDQLIAPRLVGRDPSAMEALTLDLEHNLHVFGRTGPAKFGVAGIDIALWDLAGKRAGLPLYQLLRGGGPAKASTPIYASLPHYGNPHDVARNVARAVEDGYGAVKLHETTVPCVRAAREAAGPDVSIMVDASCAWSFDDALEAARNLAPLRPFWLEEPIWPPEDIDAHARLRAAAVVPIAAGEDVATRLDFQRMFEAQALDFAQPSVTKLGVTEMHRVFALAEAAGVPVAPHSPYFGPGFIATLHLIAASPHETFFERYYIDLAANLFGTAILPVDGRLAIPQGPGLGCDPDPEVVARFRADAAQ